MLPWLKNKEVKSAGVTSMVRNPDGGMTDESSEESDTYGLNHCAEELIAAIEAKDAAKVAQCLKDAFDECNTGATPEEEMPPSEP